MDSQKADKMAEKYNKKMEALKKQRREEEEKERKKQKKD